MSAEQQISLERLAVDAMHQRLDSQLAEAHEAHKRAFTAPVESPEDLFARDAEISRLGRTISSMRAAERGLCFGRLDTSSGESLHVGRIGLRDEAGELILVDWRSDSARPFYAATTLSPQGVRRRRHLRLRGRVVAGVSDEILDGSTPTPEDVISDGPLIEALGTARTGRMRDAISTLQSEQDAIVRSSHLGVTVVQGGPGTGKTIVALHRAAYLLYSFPHIAERGLLVYGPHQRFLDYIGDVLPSLGESGVSFATAAALTAVSPNRIDSPEEARRKGCADLAPALANWVQGHQPDSIPLVVNVGRDTLTLDSAVVDRARRSALQDAQAHNPARERFLEYIVDELVDLMELRATEMLEAIDAEVMAVLGVDLDRAASGDLRKLGFDDAPTLGEQPEFDREAVRSSLLDDPGLDALIERIWPRLEPQTLLHQFLTDPATVSALWPTAPPDELRRITDRSASELSAADLALLDEMRELIVGAPDETFGHIVVDEGQELTEMEWRMLLRRCPSRSMTVVGDLTQRGSYTTVQSWQGALGPFVSERLEVHTLTVNYRTTTQILRESAPLLAELAPGQEIARSLRHGAQPQRTTVGQAEIAATVAGLVAQDHIHHPGELVGVVCPADRTDVLHAWLSDAAVVVPANDVRGLEFDAVIVVDPTAIRNARSAGANDLYVAITRATKRLIIVEPAPLG